MIGSKLFRKQFVIAALSVFACLFVGTILLGVVARLTFPKIEPKFQAPSIFPNFVEKEGGGDYVKGIRRLEAYVDADDSVRFYLLDENGKTIYPSGAPNPTVHELPKAAHEASPADQGGAMGMVIRLSGEPTRYLLVRLFQPGAFPGGGLPPPSMGGPPDFGGPMGAHGGPRGGPMHGPGHALFPGSPPGPGPLFFPASFLLLAVMVLLGIGLAIAIIFRSLHGTVELADHVISELKAGNLKARFPISRTDEIGQAMIRFNSMASEIEALVERVRVAENSRNQLLQELTHDLRTPVASLRTIQEGIFRSVEMKPEVSELAELAGKEVEYLGRLVEDLLLLAQLSEPKYKASRGLVDILSLLEEECDALAPAHDASIKVKPQFNVEQVLVKGDEHLFQRLIRNALENAFSYSRHEIRVAVDPGEKPGTVRVRIQDDGPGFSEEALGKFGERRDQRVLHQGSRGRLSLGLGSVIMKSVVSLHGGQIKAYNGAAGGAVVELTLPVA